MAEIRSARFADALALADRLRFEDAREIAAVWGLAAREGLFHCLIHSDRQFALFAAGQPEAIWGISSISEAGLRIGVPWMLASDGLFDGLGPSLLRSRRIVEHLLVDHDVLTNVTDARNEAHLRWLEWCGFSPLRRHERFGVAGRPFVEFYRPNPGRGVSEEVIRACLLRRPVAAVVPDHPLVGGLVHVGIELLDRPEAFSPEHRRTLERIFDELTRPDAVPERLHRGAVRLLLELAVAVCNTRGARGVRWRSTPLGELLTALNAVVDACVHDGQQADADLLGGFEPGRAAAVPPALAPGPIDRAQARQGPVGRLRLPGFFRLLQRHVWMLSMGGRYHRCDGYRLWSAAWSVDRAGAAEALEIPARDLVELLSGHPWREPVLGGAADAGANEAVQPVRHVEAMAELRAALERGRLAGVVRAELDRLTLDDGLPDGGRIRCEESLVYLVSAVADRAVLALLPGLRLGGVVGGRSDRQWLYRLLRAHLLERAGLPRRRLCTLLLEDLTGLLVAGRLEQRLLLRDGPLDADDLSAAERELRAWHGRTPLHDDALLAWLAGPLAVPVRHEADLAPALFTWYCAAAGELAGCLAVLGRLFDGDPLTLRRRFRSALRRMRRGPSSEVLAAALAGAAGARLHAPAGAFGARS